MSVVRKAIIPVAGLGTRFLPATKAQPKEMLPIVDKPVIQYLVEEAAASGIKDIIFVTGKGKRAIEDHFDHAIELESYLARNNKYDLSKELRAIATLARFAFVRQSRPRGNGDAILQGSHLIGSEPVAVLFGDDLVRGSIPCLQQLIRIFDVHHQPVLALEKLPKSELVNYGVVRAKKISGRFYQIFDIVEKPKQFESPSNLIAIGKYVLTNNVIRELGRLSVSDGEELGIVDGLRAYLSGGGKLYGWEFEGNHYDCGSKMGFLRATVELALEHPEVKNNFKNYLKKLARSL